ncbi:MAG: methyltransferase domain-containing protein [Flavobacteriales bacterium]|nr:methyltransferase domain-containing protein [Flavobacteriales bacterium]
MFIDTIKRTDREEIMDNFNLQGQELAIVLRDLKLVNAYLGGNKITINGIQQLLSSLPEQKEITIVDIGCGDGQMLKRCMQFARKNKLQFKGIGIDANSHIIENAKQETNNYPEIRYQHLDVFSEAFKVLKADIILCTLTLHHFKDAEIEKLVKLLSQQAQLGVVINDLHRNALAYILFKAFSNVFFKSRIAINDGLVSILRGFKKKELKDFASKLQVK